jgi:hypothetical protein
LSLRKRPKPVKFPEISFSGSQVTPTPHHTGKRFPVGTKNAKKGEAKSLVSGVAAGLKIMKGAENNNRYKIAGECTLRKRYPYCKQ